MTFAVKWVAPAEEVYEDLEKRAFAAFQRRKAEGDSKSSKIEGLFKQVRKTLDYLAQNPRHPSLHTHEFSGMSNPLRPGEKVWEAYVQNKTAGAYRIFWVYGPDQSEITVIAITPHP